MSAVKALQQWCRLQVQGYRDVAVTNMTTSFRDGLAFCALIHRHRPDLINFDSLKKENVYENNKLAFGVAEAELGIPALLDAEDMVALQIPDRLSILTYVSQYYNYFHGRSPIGGMGGMKRPAEDSTEEPPGKNQAVVSKVFPSSKPARENSPPRSRPPPSPRNARNAKQDVVETPNQAGTLSNKCVSCNKHVHLVQRHLVEGKLYHRSCAKSLTSASKCAPLRDLPTNTPKPAPRQDPSKTSNDASSRLGPTWLKDKPSAPPSSTITFPTPSAPPSRPLSVLSPAARDRQTPFASKPTTSQKTSQTTPKTTSQTTPKTTSQTTPKTTSQTTSQMTSQTTPKKTSGSTFTTTLAVVNRPTPAPRTSATAAKTLQSKIQFLQSDDAASDENKTPDTKKVDSRSGAASPSTVGQAVTITVNVGGVGRKDTSVNVVGDRPKASGVGAGSVSESANESSKAKAAAFISRKLAEENNNKPSWTNVVLKKTESPRPPAQVETPKKETGGVRGRVRLKADPSLLADLQIPNREESGLVSVPQRPRSRTPEPATTKTTSATPSSSAAGHESPADWRSKLKPVSKETKAPSTSSNLSANGPGKTPEPLGPSPSIFVTPPPRKGPVNGQEDQSRGDAQLKISKKKPDYIPKEDILKELQEIDDSLTKLEKEGVELEMKLRRCEEDGEDDSFMDELMVEWFNLIRNKQVAMRRESELVYIGRTQELEEEQPSVEQELRSLMEKPEHLKTAWHRRREEELMNKLMEIVNDRNAIVEGLDEDRLREEEEDERLNRMMKDFNTKKDKPKKKSPMSKLFSWGSKKEAP